uniref:RRM domain-containing protein n=1 Tax=Macrostomum lignano TaxID=282301 RepID=A0A1I8HK33_9PLAT
CLTLSFTLSKWQPQPQPQSQCRQRRRRQSQRRDRRDRRAAPRSRSRSGRSRDRNRSRSPMSSRKRHVGDRDNPKASKCLGVFGLSLRTTEEDLRHLFGRYGRLEDVQLVKDNHTRRSRGFAFVYFESLDDATYAKERCHGKELDGRNMHRY